MALLLGRLDQLLAELHALLGRHLGEDALCRLLVVVGGQVRGDLLVALRCLPIRDRPRSLLIAIGEVLVAFLEPAETFPCEVQVSIS